MRVGFLLMFIRGLELPKHIYLVKEQALLRRDPRGCHEGHLLTCVLPITSGVLYRYSLNALLRSLSWKGIKCLRRASRGLFVGQVGKVF